MREKDDEFIFPVADGTAKLSGRDYEFREPTPRLEQLVRSEDFSRERHGEPGESQPTESTDDAEAWKDFWSIQGDFVCRHHKEPRVQLHVSKGETFPILLKYIDVTRATHANQRRLLECRFVERIHDFFSVEGEVSKRMCVVWEETGKDSSDYQTRSCVARSMDENWKSRSESRKTGMGQRKNRARQCSKTEVNLFCRSG